jgi:uncharacterized protein
MWVLAVTTCLWLFTGATAAVIDSGMIPIPVLNSRVNDMDNVLSIEDQERLAKLLENYEKETKHQIAVLIIPTLGDETIESFCLRTSNKWGLGRKGIDDGILVCMAMKERRVRISLGIGMERYISNAEAKEIIDAEMTPLFSKGDIAGGLERGLKKLMEEGRRFVAMNTSIRSVSGLVLQLATKTYSVPDGPGRWQATSECRHRQTYHHCGARGRDSRR